MHSSICDLRLFTGFSESIGSWNIMDNLLPLIALNSLLDKSKILLSSKIISPEELNILSSNNPRAESAVKDFPDPDSPTIPNASPRSSSNDRLLTRLAFVFFSPMFNFLNSRILMMIFH